MPSGSRHVHSLHSRPLPRDLCVRFSFVFSFVLFALFRGCPISVLTFAPLREIFSSPLLRFLRLLWLFLIFAFFVLFSGYRCPLP